MSPIENHFQWLLETLQKLETSDISLIDAFTQVEKFRNHI